MRGSVAMVLGTALTVGASAAHGQVYRPSGDDLAGTDLVAVYVGAMWCAPCRAATMPATLDSIKVQLQRQARARGLHFRAVFVGLDWQVDSSLAMARQSGPWDELIIGRNWANLGAVEYLWADSATTPAVPQVIVYEQAVRPGARVELGPRRVVLRIHSKTNLERWVSEGSPIPAAPVLPN